MAGVWYKVLTHGFIWGLLGNMQNVHQKNIKVAGSNEPLE
jgi:hypothetical protein